MFKSLVILDEVFKAQKSQVVCFGQVAFPNPLLYYII